MPEGIQDLAEAFAQAASESDLVQSDDVEAAEPAAETDDEHLAEHVADEAGDQPDVAETAAQDETDELLESMLEDESSAEDPEGAPEAVNLDSEIEIDLGEGTTTVTIKELRDGFLRQSDYTRKTQELAAQRRDLEDAQQFHSAFMEDPIEFARALAVKAELLDPSTPVKGAQADAIKAQSAEEFEAAVNAEVEKRLAEDPRMREATLASAAAQIHRTFDEIGERHGLTIPHEVRQQIVDEAARRGVADLELVFEARLARAKDRVAEKKRASTARPTASPASAPSKEAEDTVDSVDDAFEWAMAQVGA